MKFGHVHFSITWKGSYRLGCSPLTVNTRSVSIFMYGILLAFILLTLLPCRGHIPTEKSLKLGLSEQRSKLLWNSMIAIGSWGSLHWLISISIWVGSIVLYIENNQSGFSNILIISCHFTRISCCVLRAFYWWHTLTGRKVATALSNSLQQWNHTYANMRISGLSEEMSRNNTEHKNIYHVATTIPPSKTTAAIRHTCHVAASAQKNSELLTQLAPLPQLASKRGEMMQDEQLFQKPHVFSYIYDDVQETSSCFATFQRISATFQNPWDPCMVYLLTFTIKINHSCR